MIANSANKYYRISGLLVGYGFTDRAEIDVTAAKPIPHDDEGPAGASIPGETGPQNIVCFAAQ